MPSPGGLAGTACTAAALAWVVFATSCSTPPATPPPALTPPAALCSDPSLAADDFCLPPERLAALLEQQRFDIVAVEVAPSGFSRPKKLLVRVVDAGGGAAVVLAIKWKPAPRGGGGFNNHPRKELAAYEFQKLFLQPDEYVVPPSVALCIPLARHRAEIGPARPTFRGTDCVFGLAAYWLENVTSKGARDLARFERDPAYRRSLATLNLVTYLIDQRDSREANFLCSTDPDRPRLFSIDNGLAFGGFKNPFAVIGFIDDWSELQVPALPRSPIERLRSVTRADLDQLRVVAEFERRDGMLVRVPPGPPSSGDGGVRVGDSAIQLGLTPGEIDGIERRLAQLLARIDRGEIALF
jgi:hypothetical protein